MRDTWALPARISPPETSTRDSQFVISLGREELL
jgi:hypothetical protein